MNRKTFNKKETMAVKVAGTEIRSSKEREELLNEQSEFSNSGEVKVMASDSSHDVIPAEITPHPLRSKGSQRGTSCATLLQSAGAGKEFLSERSELRNSGAGFSCTQQSLADPSRKSKISTDLSQNDTKSFCSAVSQGEGNSSSLKGRGRLCPAGCNEPIHFKAAFTLAEVLITLGIIGIVAAMTIPTLLAKYKEKQVVTKLKKVYSMLSQGYLFAVQEYGQVDTWGINVDRDNISDNDDEDTYYATNAQFIQNRLFTNIKIVKSCTSTKSQSDCGVADTHYHMAGSIWGNFNVSGGQFCSVLLSDGTTILTMTSSKSLTSRGTGRLENVYALITIDINGTNSPNTFGKDTFLFYMTGDGITPAGTQEETYYAFSTCYSAGAGCTAWVIYNENMDYLHCDDLSWNSKRTCSD